MIDFPNSNLYPPIEVALSDRAEIPQTFGFEMNARSFLKCSAKIVVVFTIVAACLIGLVFFQDYDERVQRGLARAAFDGDTTKMSILLFLGASENGNVGGTGPALTSAAAGGQLEAVDYLLSRGSNIEIMDKWGMTPLMWACREGHLDLARHLLAAGADPKTVSQGFEPGLTALDVADSNPKIVELLVSYGATTGETN
ncbi:MAG: ankyrin repeat domain-containing protein [Luteolibacter sp.]